MVQEIRDLLKLEQGNNTCSNVSSYNICSEMSQDKAEKLLNRLRTDMTFHGILVYLSHKQKLRYDPSWCSLMRDVYKSRAVNSAILRYYKLQTSTVK